MFKCDIAEIHLYIIDYKAPEKEKEKLHQKAQVNKLVSNKEKVKGFTINMIGQVISTMAMLCKAKPCSTGINNEYHGYHDLAAMQFRHVNTLNFGISTIHIRHPVC